MDVIDLERKNFVVTGGAGGIGSAIATRLLQAGANVAITDLVTCDAEAALAALPSGRGRKMFVAADVAKEQDLARAVDDVASQFGPISGCVANAGIAPPFAALDYDAEDWRQTTSINIDGAFFTAQSIARHMKENNQPGSIVFISSIAGFRTVKPERHAAYGASKSAVAHLASLLGVEWAPLGIRVNAVAPGYTATKILKRAQEEHPEMMADWLAQVPIARLLQPEEIANAVAFLLSDQSSGVTATTLAVDGGYMTA